MEYFEQLIFLSLITDILLQTDTLFISRSWPHGDHFKKKNNLITFLTKGM